MRWKILLLGFVAPTAIFRAWCGLFLPCGCFRQAHTLMASDAGRMVGLFEFWWIFKRTGLRIAMAMPAWRRNFRGRLPVMAALAKRAL